MRTQMREVGKGRESLFQKYFVKRLPPFTRHSSTYEHLSIQNGTSLAGGQKETRKSYTKRAPSKQYKHAPLQGTYHSLGSGDLPEHLL